MVLTVVLLFLMRQVRTLFLPHHTHEATESLIVTLHGEADFRMVCLFFSISFLRWNRASLFLKENIVSLQEFGAEVEGPLKRDLRQIRLAKAQIATGGPPKP